MIIGNSWVLYIANYEKNNQINKIYERKIAIFCNWVYFDRYNTRDTEHSLSGLASSQT